LALDTGGGGVSGLCGISSSGATSRFSANMLSRSICSRRMRARAYGCQFQKHVYSRHTGFSTVVKAAKNNHPTGRKKNEISLSQLFLLNSNEDQKVCSDLPQISV